MEDEDHDNQRSNEKVQTAEPNHPGRPGMPVEQDLNLRGQDRDGGIFLQRTEPPCYFGAAYEFLTDDHTCEGMIGLKAASGVEFEDDGHAIAWAMHQ